MRKLYLGLVKKLKFLSPSIYMKYYYEYYTGKKLDLENSKDFNEKIQWLKVYYHNPVLPQLVDKYAVRTYVKEKIGEEYLNEQKKTAHIIGIGFRLFELTLFNPSRRIILGGMTFHNFLDANFKLATLSTQNVNK